MPCGCQFQYRASLGAQYGLRPCQYDRRTVVPVPSQRRRWCQYASSKTRGQNLKTGQRRQGQTGQFHLRWASSTSWASSGRTARPVRPGSGRPVPRRPLGPVLPAVGQFQFAEDPANRANQKPRMLFVRRLRTTCLVLQGLYSKVSHIT